MLADDHQIARVGVRRSLEGDGGFVVCGEASDAAGAVELSRSSRPDLALLDVGMPGGGIAAAAAIAAEIPGTAVVMLTVSRNDDDLFDALRAGAVGYLLKDTDPERLPHALRGVLNGEAALPRALVSRLIDEFRRRGRRRLRLRNGDRAELTPREWEVLQLLREGLATEEIAGRLLRSPVTVRRHVSSILQKLRVQDRKEAIRLLNESQP